MVIDGSDAARTESGEQTSRRSALATRLATGNPSRLLLGAVVSASVLTVLDEAESRADALVAVGSVLIIYWLVHVYVEALADRMVTPLRGVRHGLRRAARHEAPILLGGAPAMIAMAVSFLLGASVQTAGTVAQWVTVALLATAGHFGGHHAGQTGWRLVADSLGAALIGVLAIALKTLLHH